MTILKEAVERRYNETDLSTEVLERFEKSPYHYPANEYKNVEGQSSLSNSWLAAS
jgi:hypothetical protein